MKRFLFFFCLLSISCFGQSWSAILPSGRAVDWSVAGISGDIPDGAWTQKGATIAAYSGTAATINSAFTGCSNQFILLGAGTFTLSTGILDTVSNCELRGSSGTILNFTGNTNCVGSGTSSANVCFEAASNNFFIGSSQVQPGAANAASWSAGYAQGATSITVGTVGSATIANGQVIILDQSNEGSSNGTAGDTGGVFNCDRFTGAGSTDCKSETGNADGRTISGADYSQTQLVTVVSGCSSPCTGAGPFTLTISPGLKATNWRSGQTPGAWWTGRISNVGMTCPVGPCVMNFAGNSTSAYGVAFYDADNFWMTGWTVENVFSNNGSGIAGYNIAAYQASHGIIRSDYIFSGQDHASNYGVYCFICSDILAENLIFQQVAEPAMLEACSGCVIGNNFSINDWYSVQNNWQQNSYAVHNAGGHMNLFEGNQFEGSIYADIVHGTADLDTIFRNRLPGRGHNGTSGLTTANTPALVLEAFHRGFNIVGNVLGTSSYHNNYQIISGSTNCTTSIYELNYSQSECANNSHIPADTLVASTLFRWGNYDTVNAAVRWDSTESSPATAGAGATALAGATTPASHTLPASFYLASRPSWWASSLPYPAIGPDVTGGSGPGGFSYNNPAATCYFQVMGGPSDGTGSLLSYNQAACFPLPSTSNCSQVTTSTVGSGGFGPPNYQGLRNDCVPVNLDTAGIPNVWTNYTGDYGLLGAGKCAVNATGLTTCRATDGNTDTGPLANFAYSTNYSGSDDDEHISIDGSMFAVARNAAQVHYMFLSGAPNTAPTQMTDCSTGPCLPFTIPSKQLAFSQVTPKVLTILNQPNNSLTLTGARLNFFGSTTTYDGTITNGASNAYAGYYFTVSGFTNAANNGTWVATGSTATTLTLANPAGAAEVHAATAVEDSIELDQYDLSRCTATNCHAGSGAGTYTITKLYDVAAGACLPGFNPTHNTLFRVNGDDSIYMAGFSKAGGQDTDTLVTAVKCSGTSCTGAGLGCRVYNACPASNSSATTTCASPGTYTPPAVGGCTATGCSGGVIPAASVVGQWGATGAVSFGTSGFTPAAHFSAEGFKVHESYLGYAKATDTPWAQITTLKCLQSGANNATSCQTDSPVVWDINGTDLIVTGESGHFGVGYHALIHGTNNPQSQSAYAQVISGGALQTSIATHNFNNISLSSPNNIPSPGPNAYSLDMHGSFNYWNSYDTNPGLFANTTSWVANFCTGSKPCPVANAANNGCVIPNPLWAATSTMPTCGSGNPFSSGSGGYFVNEALLVQTSSTPGGTTPCTVAPCGGTQTVLRPGPSYITGNSWFFDAQNATESLSPDGRYYLITSDWLCTLGIKNGSSAPGVCGGINWQCGLCDGVTGNTYLAGDIITPNQGNALNCSYHAPAVCGSSQSCVSAPNYVQGAANPAYPDQPVWVTGGACNASVPDGTGATSFNWVLDGKQNMRGDVFQVWLTPPGGGVIGVPGPVTVMFAGDRAPEDLPVEHFGAQRFGLRW